MYCELAVQNQVLDFQLNMSWTLNVQWVELEDTREVIWIRKSKKNRQHNGQNKRDNKLSTKHTHKTKDRVTRGPLKSGGELRCSGRVSNSTSGTRRVYLVTNPVISHELFRWYCWNCCPSLFKPSCHNVLALSTITLTHNVLAFSCIFKDNIYLPCHFSRVYRCLRTKHEQECLLHNQHCGFVVVDE